MSKDLQQNATKTPATIRQLLDGDAFKEQVSRALPKHLTAERFIRTAITAINKTPGLMQCDQLSFFNALLSLSQLGLEPDGRRAHLIPFRNNSKGITECQLIVDYKGLVELMMNTGEVASVHADVVCEGDKFVYDRGQIVQHVIDFRVPRGKPYAAYALIRLKDGQEKAEVLQFDEIEAVRKRSRAAEKGPWVTDWSEMAKKTAFRRASKWIKLSAEQRDVLERDTDTEPYSAIQLHPVVRMPGELPQAGPDVTEAEPAKTEAGPDCNAPDQKEIFK